MDISVKIKPGKTGFWFQINGQTTYDVYFEYIVIGVGLRHATGEMSGHLGAISDWQFVHTGFEVLNIGITYLNLYAPDAAIETVPLTLNKKESSNGGNSNFIETKIVGAELPSLNKNGNSDLINRHNEVFPQNQLSTFNPEENKDEEASDFPMPTFGSIVGFTKSSVFMDETQYPYPYPYPYPHPILFNGSNWESEN